HRRRRGAGARGGHHCLGHRDDDLPGPAGVGDQARPQHPGGLRGRADRRADGHRHRQDHLPDVRHRWPARRRGRVPVRVELQLRQHDGLPTRRQGLRGRGARWYRQHPRRHDRRPVARHRGEHGAGDPHRHQVDRRGGLRGAGTGADVPADRHPRRATRTGSMSEIATSPTPGSEERLAQAQIASMSAPRRGGLLRSDAGKRLVACLAGSLVLALMTGSQEGSFGHFWYAIHTAIFSPRVVIFLAVGVLVFLAISFRPWVVPYLTRPGVWPLVAGALTVMASQTLLHWADQVGDGKFGTLASAAANSTGLAPLATAFYGWLCWVQLVVILVLAAAAIIT